MARRRQAMLAMVLIAVLGSACSPPEPDLDVGVREVPTDVVIGTRAVGSSPTTTTSTTTTSTIPLGAPVPPPPAPVPAPVPAP